MTLDDACAASSVRVVHRIEHGDDLAVDVERVRDVHLARRARGRCPSATTVLPLPGAP